MFKSLVIVLIVFGGFFANFATSMSSLQQVETSYISRYGFIIGNELSQYQREDETNNHKNSNTYSDSSNATIRPQTAAKLSWADDRIKNDVSLSHHLVKQNIYNEKQLDNSYRIYTNLNESNGLYTIAEITLASLIARFQTIAYNDMLMHKYDNFLEIKKSSGRRVNDDLCLRQLEQLNLKANLSNRQKLESRDFNFYRLIDTYGKVPAGLLSGNLFWPGMYEACLSMKIDLEIGDEAPTRYCLASLKYNRKWPNRTPLDRMLTFKTGICLPQACDSLRFKNKYSLIKRLIDYNGREFDRDETSLDDLYCLPDDDSPMRMWWESPRALQAILILGSWIVFVIYATIRYERLKKQLDLTATTNDNDQLAAGQDMNYKSASAPLASQLHALKFFQMLAISKNFKLLLGSQKSSKSYERSVEQKNGCHIVNFGCLSGIRVVGALCILSGNVLISLSSQINNPREVTYLTTLAYWAGNMYPAFVVNAFFTITGLHTCYLLFKQNQMQSFAAQPIKWVAFILYRYLRIMPMYAVVVYYCKYLSKFTGSGPMWDYGTSSLAPRRQCEDESWLWTLLFGANFKPPLEHCIPSAWYLANDFQFFLITPVFLVALYRSPEFGKRLLKFCILAGYLAGIASIYAANVPDMRPIAQFMPHGYQSFVYFLSPSYSGPLYRMPAYLCGLLFGYNLHRNEQDRLKYPINVTSRIGDTGTGRFRWFAEHGFKFSLPLLTLCYISPIVGAMIPWNKFSAQLSVALLVPTFHIVIALATGIIALSIVTGHNGGNVFTSFLSGSFWKPMAKLGLCVSLINIEVINYIIQMRRLQTYLEFYSYAGINLLGITMTYLCAIIIHLLFEAPTKALVLFVSNRLASKRERISR